MANIVDIVDIITVPALIKDSFIKDGTVITDELGDPIHYTGGFAVVFPFNVNGEKWAFRCWYNNINNVENRLIKISKYLNQSKLPYFCQFHYTKQGIVVDGQIYPTTRMLWIEGTDIKEYICNHATQKRVLLDLAEKFKKMCSDLYNNNISHGDMQHGNIIVDWSGELFLIDYDSLYVPSIKGEKDIISGLPSYQHPNRSKNTYANEKVDFFSELIIYLSIIAISEKPSLVHDFEVKDSEGMLFSPYDFSSLRTSKIYRQLASLKGEVPSLLKTLEDYLSCKDINTLQPFFKLTIVSSFCINCGHKFENSEDIYCTSCGTKRI